MQGFVCKSCGFVSINGTAPEKCPVCGAPKTAFEDKDDAIKTEKDDTKLNEKHTPVITIVKTCGLIPEGCLDIHIRVGSVLHPMQPEHFIGHIDFYLDREFLSRVVLTPERLNPAAALHVKAQSGKLSVIESCNLHGNWIKETDI
jgi:superoxide reductase